MLILENSRQSGGSALKAFAAFALLFSAGNNYLWSFHQSFSQSLEEQAAHSSLLLVDSPTKQQQQQVPLTSIPILYSHFHKSSGTTACAILKSVVNVTDASGKSIQTSSNTRPFDANLIGNCNTPFSGPNANVQLFGSLQTCSQLLPYAVNDDGTPRPNVVAVEVPFDDCMPCPKFRNFAIMRHPVHRLVSHMLAHGWTPDTIHRYIREKTLAPPHYYMDGYPICNSMVIRQLLGRQRFIDIRPVNHDDLTKAMAIVDKFDAFVPMEHLEHAHVVELLNQTIPEYVQGQQQRQRHARAKTHLNKRTNDSYKPSEEFLTLLTKENKYDLLLYQYMLEKLQIAQT